MKPILTLILTLICAMPVIAGNQHTPLIVREKPTSKDGEFQRMPSPSVSIDLDTDAGTLVVSCTGDWEGETFLYDSSHTLVDYEPSVNVTFDTSTLSSGAYTVTVSTNYWEASGTVTL